MLEQIDFSKYYLGRLCKREHSWGGQQKSVRFLNDRHCLECHRERKKLYYDLNKEKESLRKKQARDVKRGKPPSQKLTLEELAKRRRAYQRIWRSKNRDKTLTYTRRFRERNPDYSRLNVKIWRKKNRERHKAYARWYRENFPEQARLSAHRYRARKNKAHTAPYSSKELSLRYRDIFLDCCAYCGKKEKLSDDHFIPLSKGGPNCLSNIVSACSTCNPSKGDKIAKEWYEAQSFYSSIRWKIILKAVGQESIKNGQLPLF